MASRNDDDRIEQPPQAPDLGASVQLGGSETMETSGDADGLDAGYIPPDRPYALDEDGVTGAGMRDGDSLDQRLRREQGEQTVDPDRAGRIVIADEGAAQETPDALDGIDVGVDGGSAAAEEAAVHRVDDATLGGGAPVETEPAVTDAASLADPELDAQLAADADADLAADQALRDLAEDGEPRP